MKKMMRFAALFMSLCLCLSTAVFAEEIPVTEGEQEDPVILEDDNTGETGGPVIIDFTGGEGEEVIYDLEEPAEETDAEQADPSQDAEAEEPAAEEEPAEEAGSPEEEKAEVLPLADVPAGFGVTDEIRSASAYSDAASGEEENGIVGEPAVDDLVCEEVEYPIVNGGNENDPLNMAEMWDYNCQSHPGELVTLDDIPWSSGDIEAGRVPSPDELPKLNTPKEIPLVVLVVGFSNINYQNNYNWSNTIFNASDSLARFYKDQSRGKFTFVPARETSRYGNGGNTNSYDNNNDGVVHVKINLPHQDWSLSISSMSTAQMYSTMTKAIRAAVMASDSFVDYASYDANGDGKISNNEMGLAVIMAGYEAAYDSSKPSGAQYYLWSHAWSISGGTYYDSSVTPANPDGVSVDAYITIAESLMSGTQEPISVLAHELGHYLGIPDLYSTEGGSNSTWSKYNVNYLSVMAGGVWTWNGSKYIPASFDAWSKCALGWVEPTIAESGSTYTLNAMQGQYNYNVVMVQTNDPGEYYLIENRQFTNWDKGLQNAGVGNGSSYYYYDDYAPSGGIVIWHVDDDIFDTYDSANKVNSVTHRPGVMPLYPERTSSGGMTFIGTLTEERAARPFFNSSIWSSYFNSYLGTWLDFPVYNDCTYPSGRTYSGIKMRFTSGSGSAMTVQFSNTIKPVYLERIAGSNRYETAFDGADFLLNKKNYTTYPNVVIASGKDFADALAGSYLAIQQNAPILLVNSNTVNQVAGYVKAHLSSSGRVFILGGTGAVPASMVTALNNKGISSSRVTRLAGSNRYDTNIAILNYTISAGANFRYVLVCYGKGYADSLSASSVGLPIFLVNNSALTASQKTFLSSHASSLQYAFCIGGEGVISNNMAWDFYYYMDPSFNRYTGDASKADIGRVSGSNRYKTSVAVAEVFYDTPSKVYFAYGKNYPDGLSGGPLAYADGAPMLLVTNDNTADARAYVASIGAKRCAVMGGKALISDSTVYHIMGR